MRSIPLTVLLAACGTGDADDAPKDADGQCEAGDEVVRLVNSLVITRAEESGVSDGFDLDGEATQLGDASGCGVPDDVAPDGTPGIDNAFARLLPALALTEAAALEQVIQEVINTGEVLLLGRLTGVDDLEEDACVSFDLVRGWGTPAVGAHGRINAGQTFDIHPEVAPVVGGTTEIADGTMEVRGLTVSLPFTFLGDFVQLDLLDAAARLHLNDDGTFHGLIGGGLDLDAIRGVVQNTGVNPEVLAVVEPLLGSVADLEPDAEGVCKRMSVTLSVEGVQAFLFDRPPGDTATP